MATLNYSSDSVKTFRDRVLIVTWSPLTHTGSDQGAPLEMPGFADRSVQVSGTFGSGGSVRIEGSNDGTNYAVLTDPQGNALDITAAKIEAIMELTRYIRPRVTAGDGSTSLTVSMLIKRG